jgi:hypothetical protein
VHTVHEVSRRQTLSALDLKLMHFQERPQTTYYAQIRALAKKRARLMCRSGLAGHSSG